ncbi:hypothetical protein BD289DRAFT_423593 [Coniella lustricola]|uniref:Secreted protein n=1 Tax=Coniella lustricola TaxID=2025994 RepID=A0A2T3AJJ0_9PEZI|nr:hypothetical protein BD289DRAFT_423593 [Coniella lustricola]
MLLLGYLLVTGCRLQFASCRLQIADSSCRATRAFPMDSIHPILSSFESFVNERETACPAGLTVLISNGQIRVELDINIFTWMRASIRHMGNHKTFHQAIIKPNELNRPHPRARFSDCVCVRHACHLLAKLLLTDIHHNYHRRRIAATYAQRGAALLTFNSLHPTSKQTSSSAADSGSPSDPFAPHHTLPNKRRIQVLIH